MLVDWFELKSVNVLETIIAVIMIMTLYSMCASFEKKGYHLYYLIKWCN